MIGTFPDGESALMLVCARLRYIASNDWGKKRYLNMKHLTDMLAEELYCEAKYLKTANLISKGISSRS